MTPTREQLKSIEWAGADRYGSVCPACGEPARHHPNCWLAACLAAPPPEPQAMPPIPADNRLTCPCGNVIDLAQARRQLEAQVGRPIVVDGANA